jgi:hypothetical protein
LKRDRQLLGLASETTAGNIDGDLVDGFGVEAVRWSVRKSSSCRVRHRLALVREDGPSESFVEAAAIVLGFGAEPVVTGCLVGVDYNVVTLAWIRG